jgi:hypothetical protein
MDNAHPAIMPFYPQLPQPMAHRATTTTRRESDFPDVALWCRYLANHPNRKHEGIDFRAIGEALKINGFDTITLLASDILKWRDIKECLDTTMGTAVKILHYARQDVQAIEEGRLVFPDLGSN